MHGQAMETRAYYLEVEAGAGSSEGTQQKAKKKKKVDGWWGSSCSLGISAALTT